MNGHQKPKQELFHRGFVGVGRHRFPSPRALTKMALVPKRNQSHSSILWSGRREVQGLASQTLVSLRAIGPCVLRWKMLTHFLSFAPCRVRFPSPGTFTKTALIPKGIRAVKLSCGAGDGNRTRVISLEGWGSTIELRQQDMVGTTGFEPATSCSQSRRATKLRHVPKVLSS